MRFQRGLHHVLLSTSHILNSAYNRLLLEVLPTAFPTLLCVHLPVFPGSCRSVICFCNFSFSTVKSDIRFLMVSASASNSFLTRSLSARNVSLADFSLSSQSAFALAFFISKSSIFCSTSCAARLVRRIYKQSLFHQRPTCFHQRDKALRQRLSADSLCISY